MDTTNSNPLTESGPASATPAWNRIGFMPLKSQIVLGVSLLALIGVIFVGSFFARQPEWRVLYAHLEDRDGGAVMAALGQMNVPHKFTDGGGALLVPAHQVHEVRLKLASQGLPKGGTVGFELMENQKFGVTQFQERLNFQRGLEGELARSIMGLAAVQTARVHLALPQQTAFMREQHRPSASVLLTLYGGRTLERNQIAGIVHLVASSVPDLHAKAVTVVDQSGTLLSQAPGEAQNGLDASQLQYVRQTEQGLSSRVLSILEPIVGVGNARAQITADIDFTQSESTAEIYTPNQGNSPAAVRSQQLSEAPGGGGSSGASAIGGVPGALSNQPPANAASPVNGVAPPLSAGGSSSATVGAKRDAMTNYEIDKTVRVTRNASGNIRRLSAAVLVNHAGATGSDGKASLKPLTDTQMEQINALVRDAIGFNKDRGDSVNVVNAPFSATAMPVAAELPLWKQPEIVNLARSFAPWLALPIVVLIVVLGFVRPAMRSALGPEKPRALTLQETVQDALALPTPSLDQVTSEVTLLPSALTEQQQTRQAQLEVIRQLAKESPATVANVVRNWVNQPA